MIIMYSHKGKINLAIWDTYCCGKHAMEARKWFNEVIGNA